MFSGQFISYTIHKELEECSTSRLLSVCYIFRRHYTFGPTQVGPQVGVMPGSPQDVNKVISKRVVVRLRSEIKSKPKCFFPQVSCSHSEVIVRRNNNYKVKVFVVCRGPSSQQNKKVKGKNRAIHNKEIRPRSDNWH